MKGYRYKSKRFMYEQPVLSRDNHGATPSIFDLTNAPREVLEGVEYVWHQGAIQRIESRESSSWAKKKILKRFGPGGDCKGPPPKFLDLNRWDLFFPGNTFGGMPDYGDPGEVPPNSNNLMNWWTGPCWGGLPYVSGSPNGAGTVDVQQIKEARCQCAHAPVSGWTEPQRHPGNSAQVDYTEHVLLEHGWTFTGGTGTGPFNGYTLPYEMNLGNKSMSYGSQMMYVQHPAWQDAIVELTRLCLLDPDMMMDGVVLDPPKIQHVASRTVHRDSKRPDGTYGGADLHPLIYPWTVTGKDGNDNRYDPWDSTQAVIVDPANWPYDLADSWDYENNTPDISVLFSSKALMDHPSYDKDLAGEGTNYDLTEVDGAARTVWWEGHVELYNKLITMVRTIPGKEVWMEMGTNSGSKHNYLTAAPYWNIGNQTESLPYGWQTLKGWSYAQSFDYFYDIILDLCSRVDGIVIEDGLLDGELTMPAATRLYETHANSTWKKTMPNRDLIEAMKAAAGRWTNVSTMFPA